VLDKYSECFLIDKPGYCDILQQEITSQTSLNQNDSVYRVPENLKPKVEEQIQELLKRGIIKPSTSEMRSPILCLLKGKNGSEGVHLAVDYRYSVFQYIHYSMPDIQDIFREWVKLIISLFAISTVLTTKYRYSPSVSG